jgi:hypothetical protein
MIVVIDTSVLLALLNPAIPLPADPETGQPITRSTERIAYLIQRLEKSSLLVPTPVLAEILARAKEATQGYIDTLKSQKVISIAAFDQRAAIEAGLLLGDALAAVVPDNQDKRAMKFDIQILAIAKVNGADQIISTDDKLLRRAERLGITAIHLSQLPLPPSPPQLALALPEQEESAPSADDVDAAQQQPSAEAASVTDDRSPELEESATQAPPVPAPQAPVQS